MCALSFVQIYALLVSIVCYLDNTKSAECTEYYHEEKFKDTNAAIRKHYNDFKTEK